MYCRRCGAPLHQGVVICPECGARQRRGLSAVRCARCGDRVPLGLTVCPHCGRDVHAAGPRWGLWIAGFAVVALAVLWGFGKLPMESILDEIASVRTRVEGVVRVLGPVASDLTESQRDGTQTPRDGSQSGAATTTPQVIAELDNTPPAASIDLPGPESTEKIPETSTPLPNPEGMVTNSTTEPTVMPTPTPTDTSTPEPTATATAVPTETATAAPTQAPAATGRTTYKVKSGDTLSGIAAQFGIAWQDLAAANNLTSRSTLGVGQELVVPVGGSGAPAPPTATTAPRAAQTIMPSSPTPVQLLSAPQLLSPADQTPYSGANADLELVWSPVAGIPFGAQYQVSIRWMEQGSPMEYSELYTTATSIRMPEWLFAKADQPARQYSWSVRVVQTTTDGQGGQKDILLSPSSATQVLYWN